MSIPKTLSIHQIYILLTLVIKIKSLDKLLREKWKQLLQKKKKTDNTGKTINAQQNSHSLERYFVNQKFL